MKRKQTKPKRTNPTATWTEFQQCNFWARADGTEIEIPEGIRTFKNNIYTFHAEDGVAADFGVITWLSIKRNDRGIIHDWRDLQRIKNFACGPEREAVELYPRESRVVDTSNQFHLFVMPEGYTFPFGYADRMIIDESVGDQTLARNAKQRPWTAQHRPDDAMTGAEFDRRWKDDPDYGLQRVLHKRRVTHKSRVS